MVSQDMLSSVFCFQTYDFKDYNYLQIYLQQSYTQWVGIYNSFINPKRFQILIRNWKKQLVVDKSLSTSVFSIEFDVFFFNDRKAFKYN